VVQLFSGLAPEALAQLGAVMKPRHLVRGQTLYLKGDPGDHLYVIQSGEVKLVLSGGDGQESILDMLREGQYFGEMALLDEQPRSADVVAVQRTLLLSLHRDDFRAIIERYPTAAFVIFRALVQRLRRTTDLLEESLFLDLPSRLARVLLRLAREFGRETPSGIRIERPMTQQELAELVGATRPRVGEHLQRLRRQKILGGEGREIETLRPDALERIAG
jgi:CRP/FNR family transcriptional regulator, cyclic AMP receptor protein